MKKLILVPILLIGLFLTAGFSWVTAANAPLEVPVTVTEYKVQMASTIIPANVPIKFVITNVGTVDHEVVLEKAGAADAPLEIENQETREVQESEVEEIAPTTVKSSGIWIISDAGEYQLACHVEGHFEGGMVETFSVVNSTILPPTMLLAWGKLLAVVSLGALIGILIAIVLLIAALVVLQRRMKKPEKVAG